jgi:hypothetical protein
MIGATAAHAQYSPGLSPIEQSKPWSVSATVRGFYDNNYLTLPKIIPGPNGTFVHGARDSWGIETAPGFSYNHSTSDTLLSASYVYDMQWYEDRTGTLDQTHQLNARLEHEFSQRYKLALNESFVDSQNPTVIDTSVISTPLRTAGNNIRNTAGADVTAQMSRLFDIHVSYANTFYNYQEHGPDEAPAYSFPSYSALLDRMDQTAAADLRWKATPQSTGVLGYQFEHLRYISPEDIIFAPVPAGTPPGSLNALFGPGHFVSSVRNQNSHFAYVGVDQTFSQNLNASVRAGAQYVDYYNFGNTSVSPYVDASVTYQYQPQSTAQLGVKHIHNSTDVAGTVGTTPVLDEQSTAIYLSISHRANSRITIGAMGQAQISTFNGGGALYNGLGEDFYLINLNLAYHFSPWLTGEAGFNYSKLNTALINRAYSRDVIYLGLRATY